MSQIALKKLRNYVEKESFLNGKMSAKVTKTPFFRWKVKRHLVEPRRTEKVWLLRSPTRISINSSKSQFLINVSNFEFPRVLPSLSFSSMFQIATKFPRILPSLNFSSLSQIALKKLRNYVEKVCFLNGKMGAKVEKTPFFRWKVKRHLVEPRRTEKSLKTVNLWVESMNLGKNIKNRQFSTLRFGWREWWK